MSFAPVAIGSRPSFGWTNRNRQQTLAGPSGVWAFGLCLLFLSLIPAAQYLDWPLPPLVLPIVPLTLPSALVGVWLANGDNLFTQIGLVVRVGAGNTSHSGSANPKPCPLERFNLVRCRGGHGFQFPAAAEAVIAVAAGW